MTHRLTIIGGGLAGCEAAWQAAAAGVAVTLFEQRPVRTTPAHNTSDLAELVCSNSLRSDRLESGPGLLKEEMRRLGSLIAAAADENRVPAGSALAVDRARFSAGVERMLSGRPEIEVRREPVDRISEGAVIAATGPLTSEDLSARIIELTGRDALHFYDATSPIVAADSIDMDRAFAGSRYDRGEPDDYLNCPLSRGEYERFVEAVGRADRVEARSFEDAKYFEGCLPIEVMVERGPETLAHGPMKPVGLVDPRTGERPYAVVQLRKENIEATCYNMVGFQTRMKWADQDRVFRMIPALADSEFLRYGAIHRNTFLKSPGLLDACGRLIREPRIFFAGQITGVEGYIESAASGLLAGLYAAAQMRGIEIEPAPRSTAHGSLMEHVSASDARRFQPSNIHMGLLPPPPPRTPKPERKRAQAQLALSEIDRWVERWVKRLRVI